MTSHWRRRSRCNARDFVPCLPAFEVLHLVFGQPNGRHFPIFVKALKTILNDMDLTEHHLYQRPPPPAKVCLLIWCCVVVLFCAVLH